MLSSERFQSFYDKVKRSEKYRGYHDTFSIACLILGDPIQKNELALPELLNGAVDGDKIDYMLRDSYESGIRITVDPTRIILGCGAYLIPYELDPFRESVGDASPRSVFIIDKFGGDTYEQMGNSRSSLYSRIYHHPATRAFEGSLHVGLDALANSDPRYNQVEFLWRQSEQFILREVTRFEDLIGVSFLSRTKLKRCLLVSEQTARKPAGEMGELPSEINYSGSLRELRLQLFSPTNVRMFVADHHVSKIVEIANRLVDEIRRSAPKRKADEFSHVRFAQFLEPPNRDSALLPATRIINKVNGKIEASERRTSGHLEAGMTVRNSFSILGREEDRELIAVASAIAFQEWSLRRGRRETIEPFRDFPSVKSTWVAFPRINWKAQENYCKLSEDRLLDVLRYAGSSDPKSPYLWHQWATKESDDKKRVVHLLSEFTGALGWKVVEGRLLDYLEQFPVQLRNKVVQQLLLKLEVVDRTSTIQAISGGIERLTLTDVDRVLIVPFTPTSGSQTVISLKGSISKATRGASIEICHQLLDAINKATDNSLVCFVDDHTASGTQAQAQIQSLMGTIDSDEKNIWHAPLSEVEKEKFRRLRFAFVFVYADDDGIRRIHETCTSEGLRLTEVQATGPVPKITQTLDEDVREFLARVGTGLMLNNFSLEDDQWDASVRKAKENCLGYDNSGGTLITSSNVPTSTYTALWRPGFYDPEGNYVGHESLWMPWQPLVLRNTQVDRLVFF